MAQERRWHAARIRLRGHLFRIWTASAVLAGFIYGLIYTPEWLTWWKRTTEDAVHVACGFVPYPWGDRIEATLGNFGLWVQITLAIIALRLLVWVLLVVVHGVRALSSGQIRTRD
jgi:hypothetical protein